MPKSALDWKARRNGRFYCAPACGGRCTWEAYQKAKRDAAALVKTLGPGWKARVHENLGWHYCAVNQAKRLDVSCCTDSLTSEKSYMAILGGQWIGHADTPAGAVAEAIKQAKPELANLKAFVACIEGAMNA